MSVVLIGINGLCFYLLLNFIYSDLYSFNSIFLIFNFDFMSSSLGTIKRMVFVFLLPCCILLFSFNDYMT